jgi:hypothetical protein
VTRLVHPTSALIRVLQMSDSDIIVFIEGWNDRFFYDQLVKVGCDSLGLNYQIRTAKEIGAVADGKPALVSLFRVFKQRGVLDGSKKNRASALFFLDKDVDELKGLIIASRHIQYTEYYNVENYYFIAGDLPRAVAASAALELDALRKWFGDLLAWRRAVAEAWRRWVELCLHATVYGLSCDCHFRTPSTINRGCSAQLDRTRYSKIFRGLRQASGLSSTKFSKQHATIRKTVQRYYSNGQHDALFNGKWYPVFIQAAVNAWVKDRDFRHNFAPHIKESLLATIQFEGRWADGLRRPLDQLARRIKKQKTNVTSPVQKRS